MAYQHADTASLTIFAEKLLPGLTYVLSLSATDGGATSTTLVTLQTLGVFEATVGACFAPHRYVWCTHTCVVSCLRAAGALFLLLAGVPTFSLCCAPLSRH